MQNSNILLELQSTKIGRINGNARHGRKLSLPLHKLGKQILAALAVMHCEMCLLTLDIAVIRGEYTVALQDGLKPTALTAHMVHAAQNKTKSRVPAEFEFACLMF